MIKRLFILALLIVMCIMQTACSGDKEESSQEEAITNPSVDRVISDNGAEKRDGYVIYSAEYNGETYLLAAPDIYNEAAPIGAEDYALLASDNSEDSGNASTKIREFEKSKIPEWADDKESGNGSRLVWYKYACPDFIMDTYSDDFKQMVIDGWSQWAVENGEDISEMPIEYAPTFTKKYNADICQELGVEVPDDYVAIGAEEEAAEGETETVAEETTETETEAAE